MVNFADYPDYKKNYSYKKY